MKKLLFVAVMLLVTSQMFGEAIKGIENSVKTTKTTRTVKVGDVETVPDFQWITIKNTDGINNGNGHFNFNETASIDRGGKVMVKGFVNDSTVLVVYVTPGNAMAYGAPAPSGVIFYLSVKEFSGMTKLYKKYITAEEEEKERIELILLKK